MGIGAIVALATKNAAKYTASKNHLKDPKDIVCDKTTFKDHLIRKRFQVAGY